MGGRGQSSMMARRREKPKQKGHLTASEIPDTPEKTAAYLGVSVERAKELHKSVYDFTGSYYTSIRDAQNGKNDHPKAQKAAQDIEAYVEAAPKWNGGTTYRGINVSKKTAATYVEGAIIDVNRGTASWSTQESVARSFSGHGSDQRVVFVSKTQSRGTSVKHISQFSSEHEVLVSKDSRYRVTKVSEIPGSPYKYVYVEEA